MTNEELKAQLAELHNQLEKASRLEPAERDVLGSLMSDMVKIASGEELHEDHKLGVKEQLEQQASDFETRHPQLAGALRQVMDALHKMGI